MWLSALSLLYNMLITHVPFKRCKFQPVADRKWLLWEQRVQYLGTDVMSRGREEAWCQIIAVLLLMVPLYRPLNFSYWDIMVHMGHNNLNNVCMEIMELTHVWLLSWPVLVPTCDWNTKSRSWSPALMSHLLSTVLTKKKKCDPSLWLMRLKKIFFRG